MDEWEKSMRETERLTKRFGVKQVKKDGKYIWACKNCGDKINIALIKITKGLCNKCHLTKE